MPRLTVDLSEEAAKLIEDLARERGVTKTEILKKGLGLLAAADDARRRGLKVGAIDELDKIKELFINI